MHPSEISYGIWTKRKAEDWQVDLTEASIRSWCQKPDLHVMEDLAEILISSIRPFCLVQVPGHFVYLRSFFENAARTLAREPKTWIAGDLTQAFLIDVERWWELGKPDPMQEQKKQGIREFLFESTPSRHFVTGSPDPRLDLLLNSRRRIVYFFNTDSLRFEKRTVSSQTRRAKIIAPAAGLKSHFIASQLAKQGVTEAEISFYDISPAALQWQRFLHERWDGRDYPRFIRENRNAFDQPIIELPQGWQDRYEEKWKEFLSLFDSENDWLASWERYRQTSPQFSCLDITRGDEWRKLVSERDSEVLQLFDLSNIWTTYPCFVDRPKKQLCGEFQRFVEGIASRDPSIRVLGQGPDWHFYDWVTSTASSRSN